jgi:hypothetical protein
VQISVAHKSLNKLTRAFDHLKVQNIDQPPDLTICLWDASQPEHRPPPLAWEFIRNTAHWGWIENSVYLQWCHGTYALSIFCATSNRAYYVVRSGQDLPWWVEGSPLQAILQAYLQTRRCQLTHTAAIGNQQGAVLLSGRGGRGKSTTTLSCLEYGLEYISEDYAILQPGERPHVYSIYNTAKWTATTRILFPKYEPFIANRKEADREKALVFYRDIFPNQIRQSAPIRAILSLSIKDQPLPTIETADETESLKNLMMSTLMQLPFCGKESIPILQEVIAAIPQYNLSLGKNLEANARLIEELLIPQ